MFVWRNLLLVKKKQIRLVYFEHIRNAQTAHNKVNNLKDCHHSRSGIELAESPIILPCPVCRISAQDPGLRGALLMVLSYL